MATPENAGDILNMSDEDIMKMGSLPQVPEQEPEKKPEETPEVVEPDQVETPEVEPEVEDQPDEKDPDTDPEKEPDAEVDLANKEGKDEKPEPEKKDVKEPSDKPDTEVKKPVEDAVDYKAAYEKLTAPFKANGREITVKSVDDAIALMQMGANYNKKMAGLKPNLQLLKMLENNDLLNPEKISYLIDLHKKDPQAINKLVKDSGLDPMELGTDKASEYKPTNHTVDPTELALNEVLDDIQETPTFNRTLQVVKEWDGKSKEVVAQTPELLRYLNDHMQRGIYDLINEEVERERTFGRLKGMSSFDAYRAVGDAIQARGGFNHLVQAKTGTPPVQQEPVKPTESNEDKEARLRDKKRAASTTKPVAPRQAPKDFNPLSMSDEEFAKLGNTKFL